MDVYHTCVALPFTSKCNLRQKKKNHGNSNFFFSPCKKYKSSKNPLLKKKPKTQNPKFKIQNSSRYYYNSSRTTKSQSFNISQKNQLSKSFAWVGKPNKTKNTNNKNKKNQGKERKKEKEVLSSFLFIVSKISSFSFRLKEYPPSCCCWILF